jgi:hypothetical protein
MFWLLSHRNIIGLKRVGELRGVSIERVDDYMEKFY